MGMFIKEGKANIWETGWSVLWQK